MVVGVGVPGPVVLERARGLAAIGVAQIRGDNTVLVLELLHWVERVVREPCDSRVKTAAGNHHQREAGADLFLMNANVAIFVERHGGFLLIRCGYDLTKSRTRLISSIAPNCEPIR